MASSNAEQWPAVTLTIPEDCRDWSVYDHLSVDLLSFGKGCDVLRYFIASPDGSIQKGARGKITLPPRKWKRWQIPLSELSDRWKVDPRNIARLHFYTVRPRDCKVYIDNIHLVRQTEAVSLPDTEPWKTLTAESAARRQAADELSAKRREEGNNALRAEAAAANRSAASFLQ